MSSVGRMIFACVIAGFAIATADVSPENAKRAIELFDRGRQQIEAHEIDAACETFAQSVRLDPQIGSKLNLADCREQQNRLAEAYALFTEAIDDATHQHKEGRAVYARQRADALRGKLVRVTVHMTAPPAGLVLKLGARAIAPDTTQLVDAGEVVVEASAPQHTPARVARTGSAGGELSIDIPALAAVPVATTPAFESRERSVQPPERSRSKLPYLVGGGGIALLGATAAIVIHAKGRYDDAKRANNASGVGSAQHEADLATGVAIVGLVGVAVGVMLYLRDGKDDGVVIAPTAGPGTVGISVGRSF